MKGQLNYLYCNSLEMNYIHVVTDPLISDKRMNKIIKY